MINLSQYQDKKVLLTGGLGFIGSNLTQRLLALGAKVCIIDNFLPDHGANWFHFEQVKDQIEFHLCDIRDELAMNQLVKNRDIIFNIAAQTSHSDSMADPFLDTDINCRGNLILLEAIRHNNPDARLVYVGTRAYYGEPEELPVNEKAAISSKDIYSVNRYAAEQYHMLYQLHYNLRVTGLRISNIFGPYAQMQHPRYNVLNWFIRLVIEDKPVPIFGDGQQIRDYLYVQDACSALLSAGIQEKSIGQIYNVGSGQGVKFLDLVKTLIDANSQGEYQLKEWPDGSKKLDVGDFIMDISKITSELDWNQETSLKEGFQKTLAFYRQHQQYYW